MKSSPVCLFSAETFQEFNTSLPIVERSLDSNWKTAVKAVYRIDVEDIVSTPLNEEFVSLPIKDHLSKLVDDKFSPTLLMENQTAIGDIVIPEVELILADQVLIDLIGPADVVESGKEDSNPAKIENEKASLDKTPDSMISSDTKTSSASQEAVLESQILLPEASLDKRLDSAISFNKQLLPASIGQAAFGETIDVNLYISLLQQQISMLQARLYPNSANLLPPSNMQRGTSPKSPKKEVKKDCQRYEQTDEYTQFQADLIDDFRGQNKIQKKGKAKEVREMATNTSFCASLLKPKNEIKLEFKCANESLVKITDFNGDLIELQVADEPLKDLNETRPDRQDEEFSRLANQATVELQRVFDLEKSICIRNTIVSAREESFDYSLPTEISSFKDVPLPIDTGSNYIVYNESEAEAFVGNEMDGKDIIVGLVDDCDQSFLYTETSEGEDTSCETLSLVFGKKEFATPRRGLTRLNRDIHGISTDEQHSVATLSEGYSVSSLEYLKRHGLA